jgi:PAS domain S-box-containing protein
MSKARVLNSLQAASLLSAIVDSSDDAIVSKDLDGVITSWNKGAERLFGYTAAEVVGQSITLLMPPDRIYEEPKILARIRRGERVKHFETVRKRKDGALFDISLTISPIKDHDGNIVGASKIARDITDIKRRQEEIRRANLDLEQFAYSASHDLQEPLRGIKIYSELLTKNYSDKLDGEGLEFLGYLHSSATRMEVLVRDLLAYTGLRKIEMRQETTDSNRVLTQALDNLAAAISEAGARVTADPLPMVRMPSVHLQQLFQNLIGNSIKFRSPDRPSTIRISVERKNGTSIIAVTDNGIGIAPQYQEKVFSLFKRLHTNEEYAGSGLGLSLCQRIVEQYQGRIWVESERGKGSIFRFTVREADE